MNKTDKQTQTASAQPKNVRASEHLYRALAELQRASEKMLANGHATPIDISKVRDARNIISEVLK